MGQCDICDHLESLLESPLGIDISFSDLSSAAKSGCRACALLYDGLSSFIPASSQLSDIPLNQTSSLTDIINKQKAAWSGLGQVSNIVSGTLLCDENTMVAASYSSKTLTLKHVDGGIIARVDFYTPTDSHDLRSWIRRTTTPLIENTASKESFSLVLDWLKKCNDCHHNCRPGYKRQNRPVDLRTLPWPLTRLPRRVLDIGVKEDDIVKLHTTKNESSPYVCLSHCWGASQLVTTTSKNLRAHKEEIPWSSLCKTFQDAILITRKLSIRYLWIDSLCILQDSEEDWRWESVKMASVYMNSFLTLAATKSMNGDGGLFSIPASDQQPRSITGFREDGSRYEVYVRRAIPHLQWNRSVSLDYDTREAEISSHCPLLIRAWVFQERMLSSRVLHFTERELSWECNEEINCECSGHGSVVNPKDRYTRGISPKASMRDLTDAWHKVVMEYTKLRLTFTRDRFPALSGLAQQFQYRGKGDYLAGLFRDSLLDDLLWRVCLHNNVSAGRPEHWVAPTWSWASVTSKIDGFERISKPALCQVLEVHCLPADPIAGPMGCLAAGHLKISGFIIPGTLTYPQPFSSEEAKISRWYYEVRLDSQNAIPEFVYADYQLGEQGKTHIASGQTVQCLCIGRSSGLTFMYLILRCQSVALQTYERIGCFSLLQNPEDVLDSQRRKSLFTIL